MIQQLIVETTRQGLHEITDRIASIVSDSGVDSGICTVFIQHTSASLIIQENADPSARRDLESWMNRLVKPNDPIYTHTDEGPDDMPSHIKSILTQTSIAIPILDSTLAMGTWQGLYIWEHRTAPHRRKLIVHISE